MHVRKPLTGSPWAGGRCKEKQLHLDVKQHPREMDFVLFRPGTGVSIYEFFHKFETARNNVSKSEGKHTLAPTP
jgi:hypothetical protein